MKRVFPVKKKKSRSPTHLLPQTDVCIHSDKTYDETASLTGERGGTVRCDEDPSQEEKRGMEMRKKERKKRYCISSSVLRPTLSSSPALALLLSTFNHNVHQQKTDCMYGTEGESKREREKEIKIDP